MLELLAPAGSPESVVAAVQNGADAVYMGFGDFNARRNAKNFTEEEFAKAAEFCRVRGVKTYVTLNTLASDRELYKVADAAKTANRLGADAILVQDLGVYLAVRQSVPEMPIHASTQMSIHNLEGVKMAAAMGLKRVVLARELSYEEIAYICENSPIETEVFVHGALCMCYSGQCYMSAVIGRRSGNRGMCAQPCRLNYTFSGRSVDYPLSLKDNCLVNHLEALDKCGVTCIKIEGRMRRPEYTAVVTDVYARAIKSKNPPPEADMKSLRDAFSRQGFTDAYFRDKKGPEMLGVREEAENGDNRFFMAARKQYLNNEYQRVPVKFVGIVKEGVPAKLAAIDDRGNTAACTGPVPEPAFHRELTATTLQTQLYKTGGTPFLCQGVKNVVDSGLNLTAAQINEMRRTILAELFEKRREYLPGPEGEYVQIFKDDCRREKPVFTVSVMKADQLSPELAKRKPKIVYVPLEEIEDGYEYMEPFLNDEDITLGVIVPRIIHDTERDAVTELMGLAAKMHISDALVGNIGHILFAKNLGFNVRGDFGLNIYNSESLRAVRELGLSSVTLSFELRLSQIRDIRKCADTEILAYGRLPLMITENCISKNCTGSCGTCTNFNQLIDRRGEIFPVVKAYGCRSVVLNSHKLFLADRQEDIAQAGVWGARLAFTTENARECVKIMDRYLGEDEYAPNGVTRGLYYRGVE